MIGMIAQANLTDGASPSEIAFFDIDIHQPCKQIAGKIFCELLFKAIFFFLIYHCSTNLDSLLQGDITMFFTGVAVDFILQHLQ